MTCRRNAVMDGLTLYITERLQETFGSGRVASRNLSMDPEGVLPEQTPCVFLWEVSSELIGNQCYDTELVRLRLIGIVRSSQENSGLIQALLNELEGVLQVIFKVSSVENVSVSIDPDGVCSTFAGDVDGQLDMPITVRYGREQ